MTDLEKYIAEIDLITATLLAMNKELEKMLKEVREK